VEKRCPLCNFREQYMEVCPHCIDAILVNIHTREFNDPAVTQFIEAALTNNPVALEAAKPLAKWRDKNQITRCQARLLGSPNYQCLMCNNHEGPHRNGCYRWGNVDQDIDDLWGPEWYEP
jgi:hypothetical protein